MVGGLSVVMSIAYSASLQAKYICLLWVGERWTIKIKKTQDVNFDALKEHIQTGRAFKITEDSDETYETAMGLKANKFG